MQEAPAARRTGNAPAIRHAQFVDRTAPLKATARASHRAAVVVLLAGIVSVYCGVVVNPRALVGAALASCTLMAGYLLPTLALRGLDGRVLLLERRGQVGKLLVARVHIRPRWPWPRWGFLVRHGEKRDPGDAHARLGMARLSAWRPTEATWRLVPDRRGVFPSANLWMTTGFPFGFRQAQRRLEAVGQVLIWPEVVELRAARATMESSRGGENVNPRRSGTAGEISGVRPYRQSEPLRRIHWQQTAKRDELIVCERSAPSGRGVVLVWESDPAVYQGARSEALREAAISATVSLAAAFAERRIQVLVAIDAARSFHAESVAALSPLFDALACYDDNQGTALGVMLTSASLRPTGESIRLFITTAEGADRLGPRARAGGRLVVIEGRREADHAALDTVFQGVIREGC